MMEVAVRHWITNHEVEMAAALTGPVVCPPRGLTAETNKKPANNQALGPRDVKDEHRPATSSMDQKAISASMVTIHIRRG